MAGLNKVQLIGHLGKDPKVSTTNAGGRIVTFSLATSEQWKDKTTGERRERTQWHQIVIFNENVGRVAEQYLKKGSQAYVEGAVETRKYTDQAGADRYVTEIVLRQFRGEVVLLDKQERASPSPDDYGTTRDRAPAAASAGRGGIGAGDPDDDIPF